MTSEENKNKIIEKLKVVQKAQQEQKDAQKKKYDSLNEKLRKSEQ